MLTKVKLAAMHHLKKNSDALLQTNAVACTEPYVHVKGHTGKAVVPIQKAKGQLPTECVVALLCSMPKTMICMYWARYQVDLLEIILFHKVKFQWCCNGMSVSYTPTCHVLSWLLIACAWCCSSKRGWKMTDMFFLYLRQVGCVDCYQNEAFRGHKRTPASKCLFSAKSGIVLFWPSMNDWVRWTCSECMSSQFGWSTCLHTYQASWAQKIYMSRVFFRPFEASLASMTHFVEMLVEILVRIQKTYSICQPIKIYVCINIITVYIFKYICTYFAHLPVTYCCIWFKLQTYIEN